PLRRPSASRDLRAGDGGRGRKASASIGPIKASSVDTGCVTTARRRRHERSGNARAPMNRRRLARSATTDATEQQDEFAMPPSSPATPNHSARTDAARIRVFDSTAIPPAGVQLTDIEAAIAAIWGELIGTVPAGPDDD